MTTRLPFQVSRMRQTIAAVAAGISCLGVAGSAHAGEIVSGKPSEGLVFVVEKEGELDLWRGRIADGALQQLTNTPQREERRPAWSDAAKRLLMITRNTEGAMKSNIKLLDPTSGTESGLGPEPDFVQRFPIWSPDGKYVAHTFRIPHVSTRTVSNSGVAIVDLAKKTREIASRFERVNHRMMHLAYSHNGSYIVARGRAPDGKTNDQLWLIRRGTNPMAIQQIPNGVYAKPQFTHDDKQVIFTYRPRKGVGRSILSIAIEPKAIAQSVANISSSDDHSASPSPTRDEIVFVSDRDGSHDIFLAPLGTGPAQNLTKGSKAADTAPVWSPDGERIAYVAMPKELFEAEGNQIPTSTVRVIDRKGKLLFETAGTMPDWMPAWTGDQPLAPGARLAPEKKP